MRKVAALLLVAGFLLYADADAKASDIFPLNQSFSSSGGRGTAAVSYSCYWSPCLPWGAYTVAKWITFNSVGGTILDYSLDRNTCKEGRSAVIYFNFTNDTLSVTQSGDPKVVYTIVPLSSSFGSASDFGRFDVYAPDGCTWNIFGVEPWIKVVSPRSFQGSGAVQFTVDPNPDQVQRTGHINIAGQFFTVTQEAAAPPAINLTVQFIGSGGGTVTSYPAGINCEGSSGCSNTFAKGSVVVLSASPGQNAFFSGWKGCSGIINNQCVIASEADMGVTASFNTTSSTDNCAATLSPDMKLHLPVISYSGGTEYYSADLFYATSTNPDVITFKVLGYQPVDPSEFSGCPQSTLSSNFDLHIPSGTYLGMSVWGDFEFVPTDDGTIWFKLVGYGRN